MLSVWTHVASRSGKSFRTDSQLQPLHAPRVFTTFAAQIVVPLQLNTNSSALIVPPKPSGATNSATAPQDIRDIREPVPLGADLTLLWIALTILALAALAWWLLTHKKKSVA